MAKTILLVEDDAIIGMAESAAIRRFGYETRIARSGEQAIEIMGGAEGSIDLILMDIDLGAGIDGTEAARRILSARNLPVVFLTSHSEREMVAKVRGITRYGYIVKNSGDFVLQSSIEMAFELFEAHEKLRQDDIHHKALLQTIPDLVWLKGTDGAYLACNPAFERFFGAPEADIIGKTDYDFVDKAIADMFIENDRAVMATGKPRINEEWISFAADGRDILLETIKTPMKSEDGRLLGVLGIGHDITARKRVEESIKESERKVKEKLEAIMSPEGDLRSLDLSDIVDVETLRSIMERFSAIAGMTVAILDTKGDVLVATGWQDICTRYHRVNPVMAADCTESDLALAAMARPGGYAERRCKNGLWDVVTPLYIESRHVGNIYSGQFFYEGDEVDEARFLDRADEYGLDREAYIAALRRVPRLSRERVGEIMNFLERLTDYVSRLSLSNLRLAQAVTERRRAEALLSSSVAEKEMLLRELQHRVKNSLGIVSSLLSLNMGDLRDDYSRGLFQEAVDRIKTIAMVYEKLSESSSIERVDICAYVKDLVDMLRSGYGAGSRRLVVTARPEGLSLGLKQAVPLGLILTELLTNALKYAYPAGRDGEIRIALAGGGGSFELRVSDDGTGMPRGFDISEASGLGLRIASLLAEELSGDLRFDGGDGTTAVVRFRE